METAMPTQVPEVVANPGNPGLPEFTGKPGNIMNDLAALAREQAVVEAPAAPQAQVTPQPEITAPVTTETAPPVTVPDKFKAPDGSLDTAKLDKSTVHVEDALAKYAEKERELRQKMNEVNRLSRQTAPTPQAQPAQAIPVPANLTPFEIQVANDLINEAAAVGYQMPQGQAIAQARVLVKMSEAKANHEAGLTETLRIKLEDQDRRRELEAIAKYDESVLSPEGFEALSKIRESKPWINQSPTPWTEAYQYHLAQRTQDARAQGTVQPNPTGLTAKAPPTPVGPAPRVVVQPTAPDVNAMSQEQLDAYLASLNPAQTKAFWASRGLRW